MRLFPEDKVEDPCDCVVVDHCDGVVSSLLPNDIIAGSVHGKFIHRSFGCTTNKKIRNTKIYLVEFYNYL